MADPLPLSIVEHYAYCPRQAALIHVEAQWRANADTAQGEADHAAVDRGVREVTREGIVAWLSLPVWSHELGVQGICDVVEFREGIPVPIEHKPILPRLLTGPAAKQLMVQGLCLEEMFGLHLAGGFLFTRKDARRHWIEFDEELRRTAIATVARCHELLMEQALPPPVADNRCKRCSLAEPCGQRIVQSTAIDLFEPGQLGDW